MPSPRNRPKPLSDSEIQQIAAEIAAGRPPMVWFTAAAVGVPEGRSGKVLSLGDPADGDFLQVKPTGSRDVLSFSPVEVTLAKPARPAKPAPAKAVSGAAPPPGDPAPAAPAPALPAPANSVAAAPASTPTPREDTPVTQPTPAPKPATPAAAEPKPRPAKAPARKGKTPEVTITLNGTAEGEWTVDVVSGKKRTVRGLAVTSTAVSQAAKILHPEVEEVVAGILEAVRGAQQAKVAQLQAELEQARKLLTELGD